MIIDSKYTSIFTQRFPLHNISAESIIIGLLLSQKSLKEEIIQSLNSHFFSLKKYKILYSFILKMNKKNEEVSTLYLINQLWKENLLEYIGGVDDIVKVIQKSQNFYLAENLYINLKYFLNILHYYYIKRLFVQYSNSVIQINYFYNLSINTIYQKSNKFLNCISKYADIYNFEYINSDIYSFLSIVHESSKKHKQILSGFKDLDKLTNGFKDGDLIIIAGRPSMGKTSFAINILYQISIKLKINSYMFSLEMSKNEILYKLISLISNIKIAYLEAKVLKKNDWESVQEACTILINSPLLIDDKGLSSLEYIKKQSKENNINKCVIIIDYLQLINIDNKNLENRAQEIGNITRELKLLAQSLKTTAIVLSQLNRNIENRINKRPLLSDLRESGCIDYTNLPNLHNCNLNPYIEILHCLKNYYILSTTKNLIMNESTKQHTFCILNLTKTFLCATHNHKIFFYNNWNKEDQIKVHQFHAITNTNIINSNSYIEITRSFIIKRLIKSNVYDLGLKIFHNFLIDHYIVHNSIEQDADLILMLYKDEENKNNHIIDIMIAKHRHGPVGAFQLFFHADVCKFSNIQDQKLKH